MASVAGSSSDAFFWVASRMKVSDRIASSSARIDFLRPTKSGRIMCGNTTMSRSGNLVLDEPRLLIGDFVDEPVLPFAGIAVVADRGVERHVAAEAAVLVDHVLLGHAQALGDRLRLVGAQV